MDYFFNFDWRTYLSLYPEISTPNRLKRIFAFRHWLLHGRYEGRYFPQNRETEIFPEERRIERDKVLNRFGESSVPVVVCIDVEPDDHLFEPGHSPGWSGAKAALDLFQDLREGLQLQTGKEVKFSWFWRLDPQIGVAFQRPEFLLDFFRQELSSLVDAGDEMAVHVHCFRYDRGEKNWLLDYADGAWVDECVESAYDAYQRFFEHSPHSHRFGDRWLGCTALETLGRLGVRYDLTLEPGHGARETTETILGSFPDMREIQSGSFRWDGKSFHAASDQKIRPEFWLIPLTTGRVGFTAKRPGTFTLNLALEPRLFRKIVNDSLCLQQFPFLAGVLSTKSMIHPYIANVVRRNLLFLGGHFLAKRMHFVPPAEALRLSRTGGNDLAMEP